MTIPGVSKHARERMVERHGRDLTRDEWLALVADILDGRTVVLHAPGAAGGGGEHHLCQVGTLAVRVVWVPHSGTVATVLGDGQSLAAIEHVKAGRVRKSLLTGGGWRRGKRKPVRTLWQ